MPNLPTRLSLGARISTTVAPHIEGAGQKLSDEPHVSSFADQGEQYGTTLFFAGSASRRTGRQPAAGTLHNRELLVVIAIYAILAAILFPAVFAQARTCAQRPMPVERSKIGVRLLNMHRTTMSVAR